VVATDSRHTWVALPALLDRVLAVDVGFQVNVHCVSVRAMRLGHGDKALLNIISWISIYTFIPCFISYITCLVNYGVATDRIWKEFVFHVSWGTLTDSGKRELEIVMLVSVLVFAATWYTKRKQLPAEGADDEPPQAD